MRFPIQGMVLSLETNGIQSLSQTLLPIISLSFNAKLFKFCLTSLKGLSSRHVVGKLRCNEPLGAARLMQTVRRNLPELWPIH